MDAAQLRAALAHYTGSETFTRHSLNRNVLLTDGVTFLAEEAGAWWLTDIIVSHQIDPKAKREDFQVWRLVLPQAEYFEFETRDELNVVESQLLDTSKHKAIVLMSDGNTGDAIIHQMIEYTDFPLEEITLWLMRDGSGVQTLMLPSEY